MSSAKRWPGDIDETFPDVFNINAMPPQPSEQKPGQLPEEMIRQFFEEVRCPGYPTLPITTLSPNFVIFLKSFRRPDITFAVDWALKTNDLIRLYIYVSVCLSVCLSVWMDVYMFDD